MKSCYIENISSISPQNTFGTEGFLDNIVERNPEIPYLSAIEPDYKLCILNAGLRRRMSHVIKMGVAAALECVKGSSVENPDAIITATGLGCLADTEKFLNSIVVNNEQLLNPTAFIQSTFNTIGAQIALILQNKGYNFTYVHRGFSFETALIDAMMQLTNDEATRVLVGAIDEITPPVYEVTNRLVFWRNGAVMGEGAQFFMLSSEKTESSYAKLIDVHQFQLKDNEKADDRINAFLDKHSLTMKDVDLVVLGNSGDKLLDVPFQNFKSEISANTPTAEFKHLCGEYHTAASFGVWCIANILKRQKLPFAMHPNGKVDKLERVLLYNSYQNINHSIYLLEAI